MDARRPLKAGDILHFPGMECVVQEEIGRGSNAVVYRGWYEDVLTRGERHHVLIKELFPMHPKGLIARGENGCVIRPEAAADFWQLHMESFERGNRAHLKVLEASPDTVGGNLNTFPLNDTYYTVLDYSGGRSLEQDIKLRGASSLRTTAVRMLGVLRALEAFHGLGLVHLDVSPDNALLIGQGENERVMLIDYNSVHSLGELRSGQAAFHSVKPGYTAPEVRTASGVIGLPADLFSVTAVFYTCLTGQALTPFDMSRREPPDVSACAPLKDAPEPVARMVRSILKRGLCPVASKRYQSIAQMTTDFRELIDRIDGVGITHWALWEAGRQQVAGMIRMNPSMAYIRSEDTLYPARVQTAEGMILPFGEAVDALLEQPGQATLLTGPGGIGKTTALLHTACRLGQRYSPGVPAVMYIPLYSWTAGNGHYVTDRILEYLRFREGSQNMDGARHALHALLSQPIRIRSGERPQVLLLIDGVNEIPAENEALLQELHTLRAMPGVGMIFSSRGEVSGLEVPVMTLSPLLVEDVTQVLGQNALAMPDSAEIRQLLRTPLMLSIFVETAKDSGRQVMISTADGLLSAYFDALQEKEERDQGEGSPARWQTAAAIHLVLPAIAAACARAGRPLTASELLETIAKCRKLLSAGYLKKLFPQWVGHSRDILGGAQTPEEWLGLMVQKTLWQRLGLLLQDREGGFRPTHQELAEYLQRVHAGQMRIVSRRRGKLAALTALLAAMVIAAGGWGIRVIEQEVVAMINMNDRQRVEKAYQDGIKKEKTQRHTIEDMNEIKAEAEHAFEMVNKIQSEDNRIGHEHDLLQAAYQAEQTQIELIQHKLTYYTEDLAQVVYERMELAYCDAEKMIEHMEKSEQLPNVLRILQDLTASANTQRKNNMQLLEMMIPGLIDEGKKVPWSNTTLDIEACINLFGFMEERAGEYIKLLEVLSYTQTDGMAKRYGYEDVARKYIQTIIQKDKEYLVATYCLACEPHVQKEWEEYRAESESYNLYMDIRNTLPTENKPALDFKVKLAASEREAVYKSTEFQMVLQGYEAWLEEQ